MSNCENCTFRAKYDKKPRSIVGRIWKWHIGWCPGWKAYLKSLSDEERKKMKDNISSLININVVMRCFTIHPSAPIKLKEHNNGFLGYITC